MLKKYSLKALQNALNHALSLDKQMNTKLQALEGKVLELIITPLNVNFFIQFKDATLILLDEYDQVADTIIHSSPLGLIRLSILPPSKARSLFHDKVRMSGDIELGQHVKKLFDELDIDWEGHLAHFTGDVVAHQIGSLFRKSIAFKQQIHSTLGKNIGEYLQEELRLCPSKNELEAFFNDIDELSLQVERAQAHINQLLSRYEAR